MNEDKNVEALQKDVEDLTRIVDELMQECEELASELNYWKQLYYGEMH